MIAAPLPIAPAHTPAAKAPAVTLPADQTGVCILVADDEPSTLKAMRSILARAGFTNVITTTDARLVGSLFARWQPDLVLLDLHMPVVDGFALLEELTAQIAPDDFRPVVILTGDSTLRARQRALGLGAKDFLTKPLDVTEVTLRIRNLLQTRALHQALKEQNQELEVRVRERTEQLEQTQFEMLERLAIAAEQRDDDTGRHTQRVADLSARLAARVGLPAPRVELIRRAAPLHDLGKIGVPDSILRKPGPLTPEEYAEMQQHTHIGARILAGGHSELVWVAEQIALHHHECWDGRGYPNGLAGEAIPIEARVVAVADFFDALSHPRPYRGAVPVPEVLAMIETERGRRFDPALVDAFLAMAAVEPVLAD